MPFASDGIAIAVNPQNDWLDCLKVQDLKEIWHAANDQTVEKWHQVSDR
ncbi:hypothetical protein [Xenococcus sp. PCC 7305]|nr:hypothetical protein [Xenococcus sp. PCC 7305]